jgi:hypothetical protein
MDTTTGARIRPTGSTDRRSDIGRPVPLGAVRVAHLIPLTVLPSGIWRLVLGCGATLGFSRAYLEAEDMPGWGTASMVLLTVLTEALALLSLVLVRPWGEVIPRWIPRLGGRRIPPAMVVAPAAIGGVLLTLMWVWAIAGLFSGRLDGFVGGIGWRTLMLACYLPALLWGPLLLWLTRAYRHRRRAA